MPNFSADPRIICEDLLRALNEAVGDARASGGGNGRGEGVAGKIELEPTAFAPEGVSIDATTLSSWVEHLVGDAQDSSGTWWHRVV